jgi:pilus assembly protein CpaF
MIWGRAAEMRDRLLITAFSKISGESSDWRVEGPVVTIGKTGPVNGEAADPARIALPSRLIAAEHAQLRLIAGGWMVQSTGIGQLTLNGVSIGDSQLHPLSVGDELVLGEYSLVVQEEAEGLDGDRDEDPLAALAELERRLHSELLDTMDLRRSDSLLDLDERATQDRVSESLEQILERELAGVSREIIDYAARESLYRRLTRLAVIAGSESPMPSRRGHDRDPALVTRSLESLSDQLCRTLELELARDTMESDCRKIDEGFVAAFERCRLDMTRGLIEAIAKSLLREKILNLVFGLGPIQDLIEMDNISEIMVVSREKIYIEKFGVVEDSKRTFFSDEALLTVIERIVAPAGRRIDRSSPMVDARLPDGSRVNAVIPPLAVKGPCVTIRKFSRDPVSMQKLVGFGALTPTMADFLKACVIGKLNIVVSGGTGSGKTTLLNALSSFIPRKERVVTIEDTAELQLVQEHVITLEGRPANMEGKGAVTIQDLVKNALRMRPDRIIIGECRGQEALDMLQAMNTGHDGSMTTGHANAPREMISRLETMVLMGTEMPITAIREQIAAAVNIVVQLNRLSSGRRLITSVSEVIGVDDHSGQVQVEDIFVLAKHSDEAVALHTGYIPSFVPDLLEKRIMSMELFH